MQIWIIIIAVIGLFFYVFFGLLVFLLTAFKHGNLYDDDAVTYDEGRPDWVPKDAFVIDCHTHTRASDGVLTPRQLILWHVSNGYDGMVVSDHNTMDAVDEAVQIAAEEFPDFLVIPGVEFTSLKTHLNIIGCKELKTIPNILWTTKRTIKKMIKEAHEQNAVVQFNHRDWYFHSLYGSMEFYFECDIDGWEIYNGFGFIDEEAPGFIEKHKGDRMMFRSAGTDVHDPASHHRVYTEILSDNRSVEGVIEALRAGKSQVYYDVKSEKERTPPERGKIKENPERTAYIKKWYWIFWIGDAILMGRKKYRVYLFITAILTLSIVLSLVL